MSEVIVVTSGKGGVGKTTTTANIGTGLAKLGKKVVMIDTDTGLRNLDVVLGLENRIVYNLVDVVEGNCRLKQAMIADKRCPKLFLLPTAQTRDKSAVTPEQMVKVIDEIKNDPEGFDYIILDCPAGIEQGFQNAIAGADRALVVTTPEVSAIRDADRIVGLLDAHGLQNHEDLIVNRIRMDMVNRGEKKEPGEPYRFGKALRALFTPVIISRSIVSANCLRDVHNSRRQSTYDGFHQQGLLIIQNCNPLSAALVK